MRNLEVGSIVVAQQNQEKAGSCKHSLSHAQGYLNSQACSFMAPRGLLHIPHHFGVSGNNISLLLKNFYEQERKRHHQTSWPFFFPRNLSQWFSLTLQLPRAIIWPKSATSKADEKKKNGLLTGHIPTLIKTGILIVKKQHCSGGRVGQP